MFTLSYINIKCFWDELLMLIIYQTLFLKGDEADCMYFIVKGKVSVRMLSAVSPSCLFL